MREYGRLYCMYPGKMSVGCRPQLTAPRAYIHGTKSKRRVRRYRLLFEHTHLCPSSVLCAHCCPYRRGILIYRSKNSYTTTALGQAYEPFFRGQVLAAPGLSYGGAKPAENVKIGTEGTEEFWPLFLKTVGRGGAFNREQGIECSLFSRAWENEDYFVIV